MDRTEFQDLSAGDRVQLGGRKGTVRHIYTGWGHYVYVDFDNGTCDNIEYKHLDVIDKPRKSRAVSSAWALAAINRYRGSKGRRPFDPKAAGWSGQDLIAEYERLLADGSIEPTT
jgi:hypothetical protein